MSIMLAGIEYSKTQHPDQVRLSKEV